MEITLVDHDIVNAQYQVGANETLKLHLANFQDFSDTEIIVNVEENGTFEGVIADFSRGKGKFKIRVNLNGEGASGTFFGSVLSDADSRKTIDASLFHNAAHTTGKMECYGICEDESRLVFTGVSEIKKGSVKSVTRQSSKIIVFDPSCWGKASPILNIDENDVQASHAAVVGKLNEDHLFYLQSRGLDMKSARRLITLGYLKPVETFFADDLKAKIDEAIEGRI